MNRNDRLSRMLAALLGACTLPVQAANWLLLQGTEPPGSAGRAKLWGFIQAQYQKDFSDPFVKSDGTEVYVPPKLIGPDLDDQSMFNVNRARIGVRGANFPLDAKTNYFVLVEMGNNAITQGTGAFARLTDASITLNHIPGARIRVGLFKYPGAEEGLQAIHVFDYINFTTVSNQLLLERFPESTDSNRKASPLPAAMNRITRPVGAFRDVGVQVFDAFRRGDWEHSYAVMFGNGNGLNLGNDNGKGNVYLYWSSARIFGGKGPRREDWKTFAWWQKGRRLDVYDTTRSFDRIRWGLGTKYLKKPFRVTAEYMKGKGMIFQGPHRPQDLFNDLKADGWYLEGGWYIPGTRWELDARYDRYVRDENHPTSASGDRSRFRKFTLGAQYHLNRKTRVNLEYAFRDFSSDTAKVDAQLKDVKGRFAVQVTAIF
ncbi:MAG: porin [Gammaproteobacteria bacterium]|nr:MAG: porin [Gammaproteobacteria bacterium]